MADEVDVTSANSSPEPAPANPNPSPDPVPAADPAPQDSAPAADPAPATDDRPTPRIQQPLQARIDQLTKARREAERKAAALEIELAQLRAAPKPADPAPADGSTPKPAATPQPDIETLIEQRAEQKAQQRLYDQRVNSVLQAGNGEYKDFTDRCNIVANLGGADRPDFMQIVTDPSIVPDGHKIIAALADDQNEAARILNLPTVAMSAELARYAAKIGQPAASKAPAISKAPTPIKPLNGNATVNDEPRDDDAEGDWYTKRQAQRAQRKQVGRSL